MTTFVENLLYKVRCKLIDEIADQIMNEDDNDDEKNATHYELRSKKKVTRSGGR